jgi:hypothetical protein
VSRRQLPASPLDALRLAPTLRLAPAAHALLPRPLRELPRPPVQCGAASGAVRDHCVLAFHVPSRLFAGWVLSHAARGPAASFLRR